MDRFQDLGLRQQKRAKTTVALLDALSAALVERVLDEVPVSELARTAEVSDATFFNYFPTKEHLLTYFVRAWGIRMHALSLEVQQQSGGCLAAIEELFVRTAEESAQAPNIMSEIIVLQARGFSHTQPVERAVRLLLVPNHNDVMSLSDEGLAAIVPDLLEQAREMGELPTDTNVQELWLGVAAVFFGVPLLLGRSQPRAIAAVYRRQLQALLRGYRGGRPR